MSTRNDWEQLRLLGEGGQSTVYLVRKPERVAERQQSLESVIQALPKLTGSLSWGDRLPVAEQLAKSIVAYARQDYPSELAAMKLYKISLAEPEANQALGRLKREIEVLRLQHVGLLTLVEANEAERWIVTEYHVTGSLEHHLVLFRGRVYASLKAFRSLVKTVAFLHAENVVHRDIKPHNVYLRSDEQLILGDFGITFVGGESERLTVTDERVGPRDYMPQWGDWGERLENVHTNFDVYMLGKLLWCMVAGKLKLTREYFKRPPWNLVEMFKQDPQMHLINSILDKCVVEEADRCLPSANELLEEVDEAISIIERGANLLADDIPKLCRICGVGAYLPEQSTHDVGIAVQTQRMGGQIIHHMGVLKAEPFTCDHCGHIQLFRMKN